MQEIENPVYWLRQGVAYHQAGRLIDAIVCYQRVVALAPGHIQAQYNLGLALQEIGRADEAMEFYQRAIALNPNLAEAHNNLGNIFQQQNQLEHAQNAYERALEINPGLVQAQFNLGLVLKKRNQFSLSAEKFKAALELDPAYAEAFDALCSVLMLLGRTEEWLEIFKRYEKTVGKASWFFVAGLSACRHLGDFEREKHYLNLLYSYQFGDDDIDMLDGILSIIQYFDVPQEQIFEIYRLYNDRVKKRHFSEFPLVSPYRPVRDKIRVGYLSADFRRHVMGLLMYEPLSRHDHSQFEIYLYSLSPHQDEITSNYRNICIKYVELFGLNERQAAKLIAEDDLDILVDLCGHTTDSNPLILAYKPARVQVTHLGYHGAIGLDTVDYKLTDHFADVPENGAFLIENLLPMEGCIFPFRHVAPARESGYTRTSLGLPQHTVIFGVFANIMKLSPRSLSSWRAIMERVKGALLAFSPINANEKTSFICQASASGINPARIVFIPAVRKDDPKNRARYQLLDIVLDTFPYSGGDTTLAALDMEVPVVTLCGQRHSERTSYSILMNLGVRSTIAWNEDEYVEIACKLAENKNYRDEVIGEIRRGLEKSVLVDMTRYARNMEDAYRRAIALCPQRDDIHKEVSATDAKNLFQEAVRLHSAGNVDEAELLYQQVLKWQPDYPAFLYLYGKLYEETNRPELAAEMLERAVMFSPHYVDAYVALGKVQVELNRMPEAISSFESALEIKPDHVKALDGLGLALIQQGDTIQAIEVLDRALKARPDHVFAHFNQGVAYQAQGRHANALACYSRVLALEPDYADAHFNSAVIYQTIGEFQQAAQSYQAVLSLRPDFGQAYHHLGDILFGLGQIDAWLDNFQQFEEKARPSFRKALYGVEACLYLGNPGKSRAYLNELLDNTYPDKNDLDAIDRVEELLPLVLYFDVEPARLYALYTKYNDAMKRVYRPMAISPSAYPAGKLRVGYVSPDLRDHVMGKMMYAALSRHDRRIVEVFFYSLSSKEDHWTEKFRRIGNKFVNISGMPPQQAAQTIADDNIDILVDLGTHTKGAMPAIFAHKPARIQITHIASCGAVGLDAVDFKLTDHYADVPDNQQYLIETLLPMGGCVFPYRHIAPAKKHGYSRKKLDIPQDAIVFGAFVNLLKLEQRCVEVWRQVLEKIPGAMLAFSPLHEEAKACYLRRMEEAGIDRKRIVFVPIGKDESHNQARYDLIDLVLDTFPYGGVNGTLEALDMGVPVVTLCGSRHGERTSFSILNNLGVTSTIAYSEQEFVDIAVRLASDKAFRAMVVADIRHGLRDSPLVDVAGHARNLEAAYFEAMARKGFPFPINKDESIK